MNMSFSNRELPDMPVKLNGKIKTAIDRYIKRKVPMRAFMTDFLAVKSKGDALADALNPWAYHYKGEGYEVESGVSVEESLFRFTTMELADSMPTDVINAAYYANKKRNDSAFEIGYLIPEFISFLKPNLNVLAVNPSPDMIIALEKDYCEGRRFYAVTDETIAALYRIQFPESCFITFSQFETIHNIGAILISNRDLKIENAPLLLESLSCCNKEAFIMALVPSAWFDNVKSGAYRSIAAVNWKIRDLLIVDTNATVSTPRKKILVFINQGNSQTINIKQSNYNPSNRLFTVLDESLCINAQEYLETQKTILSFWKQNDQSSDEEPKPKYRKAEEYCFSKEISLFYKIYSERKNRYAGIVYYREIGKEPNAWGRKLSGDVEKGLRADSQEKIIQALEDIIFEDAIYSIVRTDLEEKYIRNRSAISLKTIWFYCWAYLRELQKYDHQYICGIMRDRDIGDYMPVSQQGAELLELIAKNLGISPEDIPYKTVEQVNLIFLYAVRHGLLVHNPLEVYMREYSNRASERQQDVRNALVKKHFSAEEEKAIFIAITEDREVNEKILPNCCANGLLLATAIRMFTGMAIREVAALLWEDYRHVDTSCSYHFTITKFTDSKGEIILHAERENWKRFRIVPVATVLSRLLEQRWHYLIELGIDEDYLLSCPIVLQEEQIANMIKKKSIPHIRPGKISKSERVLIENAKIPEQNLVLPDDVNELSTDFNRYHGDIFLSNFRHKANHEAYMTIGEINYMIGVSAPDTFSRYYCDFSNDILQEAIIQKLRRWEFIYERMLDNTMTDYPKFGFEQGDFSLTIGPYSTGTAALDLIIENPEHDSVIISAECLHGFDINKTSY